MRRSKMPRFVYCMLCVCLLAISGFASAQPGADSTIAQRGAAGSDWPVSGGTTLAWRYSGLNQINSRNVKQLVPIWSFETGDYVDGLQSTPIVVKGVVYLYTASSNVIALDGATGRL